MNKYQYIAYGFVAVAFCFYSTQHLFYFFLGIASMFFGIYAFLKDRVDPWTDDYKWTFLRGYLAKYLMPIIGLWIVIESIYEIYKYRVW